MATHPFPSVVVEGDLFELAVDDSGALRMALKDSDLISRAVRSGERLTWKSGASYKRIGKSAWCSLPMPRRYSVLSDARLKMTFKVGEGTYLLNESASGFPRREPRSLRTVPPALILGLLLEQPLLLGREEDVVGRGGGLAGEGGGGEGSTEGGRGQARREGGGGGDGASGAEGSDGEAGEHGCMLKAR